MPTTASDRVVSSGGASMHLQHCARGVEEKGGGEGGGVSGVLTGRRHLAFQYSRQDTDTQWARRRCRGHHRCHRTDTARTKAAATWPRSRRGRHSPPDTFSPISTSLSTSNFRLWIEGLITGVTNVLLYWVIGCSTTVLRILRLFPDTSQTHAHSLAALKCQPRLLVARSRSWPSAPTLVA